MDRLSDRSEDHTYNTLGSIRKAEISLKKIQENNEAEIMGECLEEARENYDEEIVIELESETIDAIDSNIHRILAWIDHWKNDNQDSS
ncbi:hypothetical protein H4Q26_015466 [Puccinia striiformis f. sp. tritici PST-130]|nr:hypothetical protein H4Q26_015466 [Puccinia striiformis f. sp. tritici PST-130]